MSHSYDSLAIDESGINVLLMQHGLSQESLDSIASASEIGGLRAARIGNCVFALSKQANPKSRLVILPIANNEVLAEIPRGELRREAFYRALRGAYRLFVPAVGLPQDWRPFHKQNLYIAFQACPFHSGLGMRIHIDPNPAGLRHALVYYVGEKSEKENQASTLYPLVRTAASSLIAAIDAARKDIPASSKPTTHLDLDNPDEKVGADTLSARQWYDQKLTLQQRAFVDFPAAQSVRLRGAAGTGKTLAMVIKCLFTAYDRLDAAQQPRILYLTHSQGTADQVRELIAKIDDRALLYDPDHTEILTITTLQNLANSSLAFDLRGVEPISGDAIEGRKTQLGFLADIVEDYRKADWVTMHGKCSDGLRSSMNALADQKARMYFLWELLNEFACVIDAEGASDIAERRKKYLKEERKSWMVSLPNEADRQVVFDLYSRYKRLMMEFGVITIDQVIVDFYRFLDSFQWEAMNRKEGFDVLFVDEMHLFNRVEKLCLPPLSRATYPLLLMAYDVKQSPRDTYLAVGAGESEKHGFLKIGQTKRFELAESFRYTPQIAAVLNAIDARQPMLEGVDDWEPLAISSNQKGGPQPTVSEFRSSQEQYRFVFERARQMANKKRSGRNVAVLCMNHDLFTTYSNAGEFAGAFLAIDSRHDLSQISNARHKFILSMPEYVAGLQFDTVMLLDVNEDEAPAEVRSGTIRRRFISMLYLGASRARERLEFFGHRERGGLHNLLASCAKDGPKVLLEVAPERLAPA